jgi:hypothetical protein
MRQRDEWGRPYRDDEPAARRRLEADYGQADYSRDYAYDPAHRRGYRAADDEVEHDDFGLADYSEDYAYDPVHRRGYRREAYDSRDYDRAPYDRDPYEAGEAGREHSDERRSWADRTGEGRSSWFGRRHNVPSDRVIWAVVTQRLANARGLDDSDIEVQVHNSEVTLNGTVRDREDKRRAEDLAELRGVPHVQNNLRVRRRGFL